MRRRRASASGQRPVLANAGVRRRRRPALKLTAALLPLIVVGCAAAVVVSATSSGRIVAARPRAAASHRPVQRKPAAAPSAASARRQDRAIDGVLAYTPFLRAGVPRRRMIALTFDDGPSPYTPAIVRELVRLHTPATFFIVGGQLDYFSAGLRDEIAHGFVIGDHTENHPPLNALSSRLQYFQIHDDAVRIRHFAGKLPRLFRPPYGLYNARTLAILRRFHMLMVMWSVDPRDWFRPGTKAIVERVLAAAVPGTIIELHDGGGDRSQTVAALPAIIAGLRRRHYQLVTVPQLLAADPPPRHQRLPRVFE